jgi:hypothetical protein
LFLTMWVGEMEWTLREVERWSRSGCEFHHLNEHVKDPAGN